MKLPRRKRFTAACVVALLFRAPTGLAAPTQPLHDAVRNGDPETVRRLLEHQGGVDVANEKGVTPLLAAILAGHDAVVGILIDGGADVNRVADVDTRVLNAVGAAIEGLKHVRATPLMVAALLGNRSTIERLIAAGADVNAAGQDGLTPLHVAVLKPDPAIAALLLDRGANVNAVTVEGRTPLDDAYVQSDPDLVNLLVSRGADSRREAVHAKVDVTGKNARLVPRIDRSTLEQVVPPGGRPLGLALDPTDRKVYWTEFARNALRRANLDGSDVELLPTGALDGPIGLALDNVHRTLYWTTDYGYPRAVQRASLDGSGTSDLASGVSVNRPRAIAVDPSGGSIYWTEALSGRIRRANLDGSMVRDIISSGISSLGDRPNASEFKILGITVDDVDGKIYWTEMIDAQILRADLDGSNVETLVSTSRGLELPAGIAVDRERGHLYWADAGAAKIQRARLDGSGIEDVLSEKDGLIEPFAIALDPAAGRLYWTDASTGVVSSGSLDGSNVRRIFPRSAPPEQGVGAASSPPDPGDCVDTVATAGTRYALRTVNAIATCLEKVDALKAVWRHQADATRAVPSCLRQFGRLAGAAPSTQTLEGELRKAMDTACPNQLALQRLTEKGSLSAMFEKSCTSHGVRTLDFHCVVTALRDAAFSEVALRFPRATEWLEGIRPFMTSALASNKSAAMQAPLNNLDRLRAALEEMNDPRTAVGTPSEAAITRPEFVGAALSQPSATGQTSTYAARRAGARPEWVPVPDDGALRRGRVPDYRDNGDGTVTDVNTGLMWEKKCDGCGGLHDVGTRYPWTAEDDKATVWTWLKAVNGEAGTGYAGYTDWRLPSIKELQSIVDYERFNPAVAPAFHGAECGLGCADLKVPTCSCTAMNAYWSGTPLAGSRDQAFEVGFHLGLIGDMRTTQNCSVRAVRASRSPRVSSCPECAGSQAELRNRVSRVPVLRYRDSNQFSAWCGDWVCARSASASPVCVSSSLSLASAKSGCRTTARWKCSAAPFRSPRCRSAHPSSL